MKLGSIFSSRAVQRQGLFHAPVARPRAQRNVVSRYLKEPEYRARTNYNTTQNVKAKAVQVHYKGVHEHIKNVIDYLT